MGKHSRPTPRSGINVLFFLRCSAETAKINLMVCPIHVVLRSGAKIGFLLYHGITRRDWWRPDNLLFQERLSLDKTGKGF